ncbi:MAG: peptidoglycan DD-metalloendopeptidase family protein [Treponema sp.]|jgi:hypothetical protein|nr:peptidoglycan DD-metalloendopeptidase family protein [Treponema sp.]
MKKKSVKVLPFSARAFLLFLSSAVFFPCATPAMDWPRAEAVLRGNFGSNDQGRPQPGMIFEGGGPVRASDGGEIVFARGAGDDAASRLPSPLGAWAAVDHGDGLISIYGRVRDSGIRPPDTVNPGEIIAESGVSGWSDREGFFFALFDRRERRWVNPSMIITPLPDTRPPVIQSVRLRTSGNRLIDPAQTRTISQGRYTIEVTASDTMTAAGESPLAPHRIVCSVNGTEIGSLNFETCSARDGVLMVSRNGLVSAGQVYAPFPGFEVGEVGFTRGQATLEVIAQDIAGNTRSVVFRLVVE